MDDFVDSFANHKAAEVVQDAKLEMPSDDVETKITADFVEETLIQPIQKQDSLNTGVSLINSKICNFKFKVYKFGLKLNKESKQLS